MGKTDRVNTDNYYSTELDDYPEFTADLDIKHNVVITFVNDVEYEAGEKRVIIMTNLEEQFKRKTERQLRKRSLNCKRNTK